MPINTMNVAAISAVLVGTAAAAGQVLADFKVKTTTLQSWMLHPLN